MQALKRITLGFLAAAIILLALVIWSLRLAMSNVDYFKSEIEYLLTQDIDPAVTFGSLSGNMNRFNPVLRIENMTLSLADRAQPLVIERLEVEFDFWASLRQWAPVAREISSTLAELELRRDAGGRWWLDQLELAGAGGGATIRALSERLVLVPRYLKIDLHRLVLNDQRHGKRHSIERVKAYIDHRSDQYLLQISAALPDELGRGILIKSMLSEDNSLIYVNTSDLQTRPVAALFDVDTWGLQQGALDGEIWFNLDGRRARAINGNIVLKNGVLQMTPEKRPLPIHYHARFNAVNRESGWRIGSRFERLRIDGERVPGFRAQMQLADGDFGKRLQAWVERIELTELALVLPQFVPAGFGKHVEQGRFRGLIENFVMILDPARPQAVKLGASVRNLENDAVAALPGVRNLNARLRYGDGKLGVALDGSRVSLDFGELFRGPLEFDRVQADATLHWRGRDLLLAVHEVSAANDDIDARGRVWLESAPGQRPFMYLRASFSGRNAEHHGSYLPVGIMPAKTVAWLDRGILGGRVPRGDLQFHGRLDRISDLARERRGEFFVGFDFADVEVMFAPGWQHARNASGRGLFHNVGMSIELDRADFDRIDDASGRVGIGDFKQAVVEVEARAAAPAAAAVATWLATPVGARFRQPLGDVGEFGGTTRSTVDLRVPLAAGAAISSRVTLDFDAVSARAPNWGLELSEVAGRLIVSDGAVRSEGLGGRFFDDPVEMTVAPDPETARTLLQARGRFDSRRLLWVLPQRALDKIAGKSDWELRIGFAGAASADDEPALRIDAASELVGTAFDLPQPFARPAELRQTLAAGLDFFADRIELDARYGEAIRARGRFAPRPGGAYRLQGLDIAFATSLRARPPPGVHLYGYLERVALADWIELVRGGDGADPTLLQSAELEIGEVLAFARNLEKVRLELEQTDSGFVGAIDSSLLRGRFQLAEGRPLDVDLEYLRIDKLDPATDYGELLPRNLPDFRLRSVTLVFHEMLFNDLVVEARVDGDALVIDRFDLRRDAVGLSSSGKWEFLESERSHRTSLAVKVEGENLGMALAGLGFGDSIGGGRVELDGGFVWAAPALGLELENLVGDANLKIRDGVLNNVEPGSGRFVGLLSLSALPRRLSLDFSDLLIKGMEFDRIAGSYHLERGKLRTNDTKLEGPSATIRISGTTGILERDYDQVIRVTPKIRQTLPVIGAVSAGSSVGWGLLLLQNLFKKSIDKAVEIEYRVTGSWDDPKVELIKAVDENQQEVPQFER